MNFYHSTMGTVVEPNLRESTWKKLVADTAQARFLACQVWWYYYFMHFYAAV